MSLASTPVYHEEASGWLKILDSLQHENVRLKNRIAEVIRKDINGNTLDQAELILSSIINKEAVIALLRRDIVQHMKDIANGETEVKQTKLREDVGRMQDELKRLAAELANYISTAA